MGKPTQILAQIMSLVPRLVNAEVAKMALPKGDAGEAGPQGERGARGQRGDRGGVVTNAAIVDGELILTVDEEDIIPVGNVIGPQGEMGARGAQGDTGAQGECGVAGADGLPGVNGEPGEPGADGIDGVDGAPGTDGDAGTDGAQGEAGEAGQTGRGVEKAFVDNGQLVVAYTDGEQSEVGYVVGERGQRGQKGPKGAAGATGGPGLVGLGFAWMGEYDNAIDYYGQGSDGNPNPGQGSVVRHKGSVYVAVVETSEEPRIGSEFWDVFI